MKCFHILLIVAFTFSATHAQSTHPSQDSHQQDTLKKANSDVVVSKRVVQEYPSVNKTMQLTEIQKIQEEKKREQADNNKTSYESKTPEDVRTIEQQQQKSTEQLESKPE